MSLSGKRPAHQNKFAFKHNKNSVLTESILSIPNVGLCNRCYEIIEWRKKYRKYKPIKQPTKCSNCEEKRVRFAYHKICTECSRKTKFCPKCLLNKELKTEN